MIKKLSILILLSYAVGTYAMEDAGLAGNTFGGVQAGNSNAGTQAAGGVVPGSEGKNVLLKGESDALAKLEALADDFVLLTVEEKKDFWKRFNELPQNANEVIRLKSRVLKVIDAHKAKLEETKRKEEAKRKEEVRKQREAVAEAIRQAEEATLKEQQEEAKRLAEEQSKEQGWLLTLTDNVATLEQWHEQHAKDPSFDSKIPQQQFQRSVNLVEELCRDGVTQQIREDAAALRQRITAFSRLKYAPYITSAEPMKPGAREVPQGHGKEATAGAAKRGGNSGPQKPGRSWIKPAVGITLVTLAGYGLWRWYTNNDKAKTK